MSALRKLDDSIASCRRCARLADFLSDAKVRFPHYHAAPVLPFGGTDARLLVVGLAPGMHGANRSGRPFTGDHAGIMLYETLHRFGFASRPVSVAADDGLELVDCRITNAVKCLPPANRPLPAEVRACNAFLADEIGSLQSLRAIVALGRVAHEAVLRACGMALAPAAFAHGACHTLPRGRRLYDSYHCSRYNTQTRRLSADMFCRVFEGVRRDLDAQCHA